MKIIDLAKKAKISIDDLLVKLQDMGLDYNDAEQVIAPADIAKAAKKLAEPAKSSNVGSVKITVKSSGRAGKISQKVTETVQLESVIDDVENQRRTAQAQEKLTKKEDKPSEDSTTDTEDKSAKDKKSPKFVSKPSSPPPKKSQHDRDETPETKKPSPPVEKDVWSKSSTRAINTAIAEGAEGRHGQVVVTKRKAITINNKHGFNKPAVSQECLEVEVANEIEVSNLAKKIKIKPHVLVKKLCAMGEEVQASSIIDADVAALLLEELGHVAISVKQEDAEQTVLKELKSSNEKAEQFPRCPVVTIMGHVDHGKTSLLDYIRSTKVAEAEAGNITQHIGAYHVHTKKGNITFFDTPGHAAFTAMRARGAQCTDIAIIIVASDDSVMPQTREAVKHVQNAGVPMIVAISKIDKPGKDISQIKNDFLSLEVVSEDMGGDVQFIPLSSHTGEGIDDLLEAIVLQAEILELQAPKVVPAQGVVIESRVHKGRGKASTLLVQRGTLKKGDIVLAGQCYGRIRSLLDDMGKNIDKAIPCIPTEVFGLDNSPDSGNKFIVVDDEKQARAIISLRQQHQEEQQLEQSPATIESMFDAMSHQKLKVLNILIKADVRGSLEAISNSIQDIENDQVNINIVYGGVGGISDSDVSLALATEAIILGFNVRMTSSARAISEREKVEVRYYSVIYTLIEEVEQAVVGLLDPIYSETIIGTAEVRDIFKSPKMGTVAGCMVRDGSIKRNNPVRVLRDEVVIYEGTLESLRRFKEDAKEVQTGIECGIAIKDYNNVEIGDLIEVFEVKQVRSGDA